LAPKNWVSRSNCKVKGTLHVGNSRAGLSLGAIRGTKYGLSVSDYRPAYFLPYKSPLRGFCLLERGYNKHSKIPFVWDVSQRIIKEKQKRTRNVFNSLLIVVLSDGAGTEETEKAKISKAADYVNHQLNFK
jgi:hypothetical protein